MRIDYLIPKLYASTLVAVCFVCLVALRYAKKRVLLWLLLPTVIMLFLAVSTQFFLAELLLAGAVAWGILQLPRSVLQSRWLSWSIASMLVFQSLTAIGQFVLQRSLFGYWFLGEGNLLRFTGIATQTLAGREFILPSGTTAHPNVLAGVLVIGCGILWQKRADIPRPVFLSTLALSLVGLALTFSISAWSAALFCLIFFCIQHRLDTAQKQLLLAGIWSLVVIVPIAIGQLASINANPSLTRRAALNAVALNQFAASPILGVGLNSFTRELASTNSQPVLERFIQPAHHVPLLILAETGVVGALLLMGICIWILRKNFGTSALLLASCIVVPLITLDHYLYTLETGRLAVAVLLLMVLVMGSAKELELGSGLEKG